MRHGGKTAFFVDLLIFCIFGYSMGANSDSFVVNVSSEVGMNMLVGMLVAVLLFGGVTFIAARLARWVFTEVVKVEIPPQK